MAKQINLGKFRGEDATINGVNTLTIKGSQGIHIHQSGSDLTISGDGFGEHVDDVNNPHCVTKQQIGLGNVDNKSEKDIIDDVKVSLVPSDISDILGFMPADARKTVTRQEMNTAISESVSTKQDTLHGNQNQIVGFDASGNAIAIENKTMKVDDRMILNSVNPVQSKVIQAALADSGSEIASLENTVEQQATQIGGLINTTAQHTDALQTVNETLTGHSTAISQINTKNTEQDGLISGLRTDMSAANSSIVTHTSQISAINDTIVGHSGSIQSLDSRTSQNETYIETLQIKTTTYEITVKFNGPSGDTDWSAIADANITVLNGHDFAFVPPVVDGYVPDQEIYKLTNVKSNQTINVNYSKDISTATLTIIYSGAGSNTPARHTEEVLVGASYSVASPVVSGYTPDTDTVTGTMPKTGATVVVVYSPKKVRITFHHEFIDPPSSAVVPTYRDVTITLTVGEAYTYSPRIIHNAITYLFYGRDDIYGQAPEEDTTVTVAMIWLNLRV